VPRAWLRPLARIGGWIGWITVYSLLRWTWTADRSGDLNELWVRSTLAANVLAGISAAVGTALLTASAVEFGSDPTRRRRRWAWSSWIGAFLLPGHFVGQVLTRTLSQSLLENIVLPQPGGASISPQPWYTVVPPVFVSQAGTASTVAGFVLVIVAQWRLAEARRAVAAADQDSGRWE
jgi:hypothetical protein